MRTKRGADRLVQKLARHDVARGRAARRHDARGARAGARAVRERARSTTLVATDVAARGLDLDDITHVINFDPPEEDTATSTASAAPAARAAAATGVTLVLPEQQADVSRVARRARPQRAVRLGRHEGRAAAPLVYSRRAPLEVGLDRPRAKI